jgi:hypothetical protein
MSPKQSGWHGCDQDRVVTENVFLDNERTVVRIN